MKSTIVFKVGADNLIEIIALGLAMVDKTQLDPHTIKLNDQVFKWNRVDAVALISGSITEQQYIERNCRAQK